MSEATLRALEEHRKGTKGIRKAFRSMQSIDASKTGLDLEFEQEMWDIGQCSVWFITFVFLAAWICVPKAYYVELKTWGQSMGMNCTKPVNSSDPLLCLSGDQDITMGVAILTGRMTANLICGVIFDLYGRKFGAIMFVVVYLVCSIVIVVNYNFVILFLMRFIISIAVNAVYLANFCSVLEIAAQQTRCVAGILYHILYAVGLFILALCHQYDIHWRQRERILFLVGLVLIFGLYWVPESPRWLHLRHRDVDMWRVIRKINGLGYRDDIQNPVFPDDSKYYDRLIDNLKAIKGFTNYSEFNKRFILLLLIFLIGYSGMMVRTEKNMVAMFDLDLRQFFFLMSFVAVCTYILALPLYIVFGRKFVCVLFFFISALLMFVASLIQGHHLIVLGLSLASRVLISNASIGLLIMAAEAFPTCNRCTIMGLLLLVSYSGVYLSNKITEIVTHNKQHEADNISLGIRSLLSAFLMFLLPPTRRSVLQNTNREAMDQLTERTRLTGFGSCLSCF